MKSRLLSAALFAAVFLFLAACNIVSSPPPVSVPPITLTLADSGLQPIEWGDATSATVTLAAQNKMAILVKMNTGGTAVSYSETGSVTGTSGGRAAADTGVQSQRPFLKDSAALSSAIAGAEQEYVHFEPAQRFGANPPPISRAAAPAGASRSVMPVPQWNAAAVGAKKPFWITTDTGEKNFVQKTGTLLAISGHAEIWALKNGSGEDDGALYITEETAQAIGQKFDIIYEKETGLIGYEYGGEPDSENPGGIDGNPRILILLYELPQNNVIGYFWAKDEYTDADLAKTGYAYHSNKAEIFYMNSIFYDKTNGPNTIYSTLAHEFQHMIHFNQKSLKSGISSSTWYNEMLSMVTEDIISPFININVGDKGHPATDRLKGNFTYLYWYSGINELGDRLNVNTNVAIEYANMYAYGAYLVRNYGGAKLLREMVQNKAIDTASITAAISAVGGGSALNLFDNYITTVLNPTSGGYSFNKTTAPYTVNDTAYQFDAIQYSGQAAQFFKWPKYLNGRTGPLLIPYNTFTSTVSQVGTQIGVTIDSSRTIAPKGFIFESDTTWVEITSPLSITLSRPRNSNIRLYMLVL